MIFSTSVIQFDICNKNPDVNRGRVKSLILKSLKQNPDLIVLPETWTTGFSKEVFINVEKHAETINGKSITMLREMARQHSVWIVSGSIIEKDDSSFYNTIFLINNRGQIAGKYRKMHLFSLSKEDSRLINGTRMPVFETEIGKLALMTCYDIRYVELARTYALKGAEVIIVVANFPEPRVKHWRILLQARAIENQLFIIACNRTGPGYFGNSMIIDPWGKIIEEVEDEEIIINGKVNLARVEEVRESIPMFRDRQPQSYPPFNRTLEKGD